MDTKRSQANTENSTPPDFKTAGEKNYDAVFGFGINFVFNLLVSAAFTHWVKHSTKPWSIGVGPLKKNFTNPPSQVYNNIVAVFEQWPIMNALKTPQGKTEVAKKMADVLTLVTAGHAVMIPSVWLGEKFKSNYVEWIDRMHYGNDMDDNVWIRQRHEDIENRTKPTLLGAVTGRFGTVVATQITAYTIGSEKNIISTIGKRANLKILKEFPGLDKWATAIGENTGGLIAKTAPQFSAKINETLRNSSFSFSEEQMAANIGRTYDSGLRDYSKYTALDVLYTAVTSMTIHPIIKALKEHVPGMSYGTNPKHKDQYPHPGTRISHAIHADKLEQPELAASR